MPQRYKGQCGLCRDKLEEKGHLGEVAWQKEYIVDGVTLILDTASSVSAGSGLG